MSFHELRGDGKPSPETRLGERPRLIALGGRMEIGIDSFAALFPDPVTGQLPAATDRMADLLDEVELADRFGVSRGPIREALRVLENEGLIVRRPRLGSYVAPLDEADSREIYEVREVIEPLAVRLSLERHPIQVVEGLRIAMRAMESALEDGDFPGVARADLALHSQFYEWAENDRLKSFWDTLKLPLQLLVVVTGGGRDLDDWRDVVSGHLPLVHAAEAGNIDDCVAAATAHLHAAKERLLRVVRSRQEAAQLEVSQQTEG